MRIFVPFTIGFFFGCALGWTEVVRLFHKLQTFFMGMIG
jgi:hypothetical protein